MKVTRVLQPTFALSYPVHRGRLLVTRALVIAYVGEMPRRVFMGVALAHHFEDNDNEPRT